MVLMPFCKYVHPATDGLDVYSMDDKAVFGETLRLSTSEAVQAGLIKAFKVTAFSLNIPYSMSFRTD